MRQALAAFPNGVGLAANQFFEGNKVPRLCLINDTLVINGKYFKSPSNPNTVMHVEECLSDPGVEYIVPRYEEIIAEYWVLTEKNKLLPMCTPLTGTMAYIFQHEIDHLLGKPIWVTGRPVRQFVAPSKATPALETQQAV